MAYDEHIADRIRKAMQGNPDVQVKTMFGGIVFMVRGHMAIGVNKSDLMVRVGKPFHDEAIGQPHARTMDFTNKPMKGYVFVNPDGYQSDADLQAWIDRALRFNATLEAK
jgi:TfoX/Sxy family transcriptional regulator of competence genes